MSTKDIATIKIGSLPFSDLDLPDFLHALQAVHKRAGQVSIVTPNVDFVVRAYKDKVFKRIINQADIFLCDSSLIKGIAPFLGVSIKQRLTGYDAMVATLEFSSRMNESVFLLGSRKDTLSLAGSRIVSAFSGVKIAGTCDGFFDWKESPAIVDKINASGAMVLFIGMGSPRQEKWAAEFRKSLNVKFILCVGGVFDIFAGKVKRAPVWMQKCGLEWFWRLMMEPRRLWKRYLIDDPVFFWLVLKQKLGWLRDSEDESKEARAD